MIDLIELVKWILELPERIEEVKDIQVELPPETEETIRKSLSNVKNETQ
jgi:hypothetical protein